MNPCHYNKKNLILTIIALVYIFDSILLNIINNIKNFNNHLLDVILKIDLLSISTLIFIFLFLLNNYFWKFKLTNFLIKIPNFNGSYLGTLESTFRSKEIPCRLEIKQSASNINITMFFKNNQQESISQSYLGMITKNDDGFYYLHYMYLNEPDISNDNLNIHKGTCRLKYLPEQKQLIGEYYNDRGYKGSINLKYKSSHLKGSF